MLDKEAIFKKYMALEPSIDPDVVNTLCEEAAHLLSLWELKYPFNSEGKKLTTVKDLFNYCNGGPEKRIAIIKTLRFILNLTLQEARALADDFCDANQFPYLPDLFRFFVEQMHQTNFIHLSDPTAYQNGILELPIFDDFQLSEQAEQVEFKVANLDDEFKKMRAGIETCFDNWADMGFRNPAHAILVMVHNWDRRIGDCNTLKELPHIKIDQSSKSSIDDEMYHDLSQIVGNPETDDNDE
jgi:hypothetical protein